MLSTRFITILAFIVTVNALPAYRKPVFKLPVTSLKRADLEDTSPWIKFPHFGNVLKSFPNFLPTIPEAAPKIENDGHKFQVIVNVKEYDKDYLKVVVMGTFIHIQGAHEDARDRFGAIDSQFIQTYTLPPKSSASSVTAVLTSDDYLVVTAPIGSVVNKVSYKEKEIPVIATGEPLIKPEIEETKDTSSTSSPESLIQAIPPTVLLPPKPINDVIINVEPFIPIPNTLATELLPPKITYDEAIRAPTVSPGLFNYENGISSENKVDQSPIITSTATNIEKTPDALAIVPSLISIPLQIGNKDEQFIIGPTYDPLASSISVTDNAFISEINAIQSPISNQATLEEDVNIPLTQTLDKLSESQNINEFQLEEVIPIASSDLDENNSNVNVEHGADNIQTTPELRSIFMEPLEGHVMVNRIDEEIITTEKPLVNSDSDDGMFTSTSTQEQTTKINEIMEIENIQDFTTEMFLYEEVKTTENTIPPVLRSEIFQESDNFTEDPEIEPFNKISNSTNTDLFLSEMLFESTTDDIENIIDPTINFQPSLENESVKTVESSTSSQVVIEKTIYEENNNITTESYTLVDENVFIAAENLFEEQKNDEEPKESTPEESFVDVAMVSYTEDVGTEPSVDVSTEKIIYFENDLEKTSEVNEF